jgi:hypothetical protein
MNFEKNIVIEKTSKFNKTWYILKVDGVYQVDSNGILELYYDYELKEKLENLLK